MKTFTQLINEVFKNDIRPTDKMFNTYHKDNLYQNDGERWVVSPHMSSTGEHEIHIGYDMGDTTIAWVHKKTGLVDFRMKDCSVKASPDKSEYIVSHMYSKGRKNRTINCTLCIS